MQKTKINDVPVICQHPEMPTGCEATALTMLLNWYGLSVDKYEVAESLTKGERVELIDGRWVGGNPDREFVGSPYEDEGSFGVFEGPILEAIEAFLPGRGFDMTNHPFDEIRTTVRSGKPVMAWTTIDQKTTFHSKTWIDKNGNMIEWYRFEHAVVIVGFDDTSILVNDPTTGKEEAYDRDRFEANWASMGRRAVTLKR